ncbi:MAG: hypothetical protein J5935_01455 [Lachnospiraceae bacterium]|nr:hypothetical protein [Lachnospiraceae bacterium]
MKKKILLFSLLYLLLSLCISLFYAFPFTASREGFSFDTAALQAEEIGRASYDAENVLLQKGIYTVEVPYEAKDYAMAVVQADGLEDSSSMHGMRGTIFTFFPEKTFLSFRLYIDSEELNTHFRFFPTTENSAFRPHALHITYMRGMTVLYYFLRAFVILAGLYLAGLFVYALFRAPDTASRLIPIGFVLVFFAMNLPFFESFYPHGHDTNFHMLRVEYIAEGLRTGDFPVRMQVGWFNDYGLPVGVYYPDLFLYPAAFLYLAGVPLFVSYRFYGMGMNLLAILVSYISFRKISGDKVIGFFSSALYALSVRYFMNTYPRGAAGEAAAMVFLPLIALGLIEIGRKKYKAGAVALALGFTGVMQSHVISVRMVLVFCVITCLLCGRTFFTAKRLLAVVSAAFFTLCLNAGFIVPFLDYFLKNDIEATGSNEIFANSGISLQQVFLKQGELSYSPGWAIGLLLLVAAFVLIAGGFKKQKNGFYVSFLVALLAVFMSMEAFPYDALNRVLPFTDALIGSFMRIKSRYLSIAAVAFVVLAVYTLQALKDMWRNKQTLFLAVCFSLFALALSQNVLLAREYIAAAESMTPYSSAGITPYAETLYVYNDVDLDQITDTELHVLDDALSLAQVARNGLHFSLTAENASSQEASFDLPIWNYSGYRALASTGESLPVSVGENHRVRVTLPSGFSGIVDVRFHEPLYWRLAELLSLVSVLCLLGILWQNKRRPRTL